MSCIVDVNLFVKLMNSIYVKAVGNICSCCFEAGDEGFSDNYMSRTPSPGNSDISDEEENTPQKSDLASSRRKQANPVQLSSMIDLSYWRK